MKLFKIITARDEIVIGVSDDDPIGADAGSLAAHLAQTGHLSTWQYAVTRGADGGLVQGPLRKVGLLASESLRVEPYSTPYAILAPQPD